MTVIRKPFVWRDPDTKEKYELWLMGEITTLLSDTIETEEQAKSFMDSYEQICPNAESNIGFIASRVIKDEALSEDILDLFLVEPSDEIHQTFGPDDVPYGSSFGIKIVDGKTWTLQGIQEDFTKPKKAKK